MTRMDGANRDACPPINPNRPPRSDTPRGAAMSGDAETLTDMDRQTLIVPWEHDDLPGYYAAVEAILAAHAAAIRADHERAILQGFIERMPATGEAPDYIHALSTAALALRAAQPTEGESAYVWTRNDRADHEAGHPSGYDCDGYAMSGRERCAHGGGVVTEHTAENDRVLLTRWDVSCPRCKAQPGKPCRRPNGDKMTDYYGRAKFHAARQGRVIPPEGGPDA